MVALFRTLELVISIILVLLSYLVPLYFFDYNLNSFDGFNFLAIYIVVIAAIVFLVSEYTNGDKVSKSKNILKVFVCCIFVALLIASADFFLKWLYFPRSLIIFGFIFQVVVLSILRVLFRSLSRKKICGNLLIIGLEKDRDWLFEKAQKAKLPKELVKGYFSICKSGYRLDDVINGYSKIFISDKALKMMSDGNLSILTQSNAEIVIIPRKYEISVCGGVIVPLEDSVAVSIKDFNLTLEGRVLKRIFDVCFSLIAIILSSPIMLIVALAIFLEDRKNPFFVQDRITRNGKKFSLVKFRSMRVNAESKTGAMWATSNDDRITKVGKVIRPLWLDELPQFFNVLKGDMSVVGPRPERQELIDEFSKETPEFLNRTKVKAGITGYAQVLTNYGTLPENKLKLDLIYMRRWSLMFDFFIVFETVRVIFTKILKLFFFKKELIEIKVKEVKDKNYIEYVYE